MEFSKRLLLIVTMVLSPSLTAEELIRQTPDIPNVINREKQRIDNNQQRQQEINQIADKNDLLLKTYEATLDSVESLEVYNSLLKQQLDNQDIEINQLQESIANATVIERRIIPLLQKMVDSLERFIELDIPFLSNERAKRISTLKSLLVRSDVSASEKTRRVFEAYEIEIDYGRSVEKYTDTVIVDGQIWDAEILRVGRISLSFVLLGQNAAGYWDHDKKTWSLKNDGSFRRFVNQGLKIAAKETAPQLMTIAVSSNVETRQGNQ